MKILSQISAAFSTRVPPPEVVQSAHPATHEYNEALHFRGRDWREINCDEWARYSDAIYAFAPSAFCYFLPGMLSAEIRENRADLLITSTLLNMLDRSPNMDTWDDFFVERWPLFTAVECNAVQEWILWLADQQAGFDDDTLMRSYETLEMLATQHGHGASADEPTRTGQ
jgi:hypothetical protein